jgi:hypothetical protein
MFQYQYSTHQVLLKMAKEVQFLSLRLAQHPALPHFLLQIPE